MKSIYMDAATGDTLTNWVVDTFLTSTHTDNASIDTLHVTQSTRSQPLLLVREGCRD